jgi:hypothetical protein
MNKKFNWMPICKVGTHTDKNNQTVTVDEAFLDKIVSVTDLSKEPQFVIEHPKFDKIGFGTISQLKRVGQFLFALPKTVEEKFKDFVNKGDLPGRSVTLDKNTFELKNISFLPLEVPPAVSGLGAYSFSVESKDETENMSLQLNLPDNESHFASIEDEIEFAQYQVSSFPFKTIQSVFRNLKNFFIEKFSMETADEVLPEYFINEIGEPPLIFEKVMYPDIANTSFSKHINEDDKMKVIDLTKIDLSKVDPNLRAVIEGLNANVTELQTSLQTKDTELQAATSKIATSELEARRTQVLQFCESNEAVKKVKPADKEKVVNFLLAQKEKGVIEFSAADNSKVQLDAFEFAKGLVLAQPDFITEEELAKKTNAGKSKTDLEFAGMNVNEESLAIHKRAIELQAADSKLTYEFAVNKAAAELQK